MMEFEEVKTALNDLSNEELEEIISDAEAIIEARELDEKEED